MVEVTVVAVVGVYTEFTVYFTIVVQQERVNNKETTRNHLKVKLNIIKGLQKLLGHLFSIITNASSAHVSINEQGLFLTLPIFVVVFL